MSFETQGSVQVVVRLRPLNRRERRDGTLPAVTTNTDLGQVTLIKGTGVKAAKHMFQFGHVYGSFCTQEEIYQSTLKPIIADVCNGIESTVFAYGQTGTGKTYTMEGIIDDEDLRGLIPRACAGLFKILEDSRFIEKSIYVSYLEIYNEELSDLLVADDSKAQKLSIVTTGSNSDQKVYCRNLTEQKVTSVQEIISVLRKAQEKRKTAETRMNKASSRSHCLFTLNVHSIEQVEDGSIERNGKLHLVDLAGSECAKNIEQSRMRESSNINQSLLTLGRVITALKEKQPRIPYRDCKLTRILQEALGGRSLTCIIATISPSILCVEETHSTLNFAERAHGLQNKRIRSDVKMAMPTPNTPNKDSKTISQDTTERFRDMEIRLKYMEAQCQEAQSALARKHMLAKEASERAENLESQINNLQSENSKTRAKLKASIEAEKRLQKEVWDKAGLIDKLKSKLNATAKSERILHHQASSLIDTLKGSTDYIDCLYEEVQKHQMTHKHEREAARKYLAAITNLNSEVQGFEEKARDDITAIFGEVKSCIETAMMEIETSNKDMKGIIKNSLTKKEALCDQITSSIVGSAESVECAHQKIQEGGDAFQHSFKTACCQVSEEIAKKLEKLMIIVREKEYQVGNWGSKQRERSVENQKYFEKQIQALESSLDMHSSEVDHGIAKMISSMKEQSRKTKSFVEHVAQHLYDSAKHADHLADFNSYLMQRLDDIINSSSENISEVSVLLTEVKGLQTDKLEKNLAALAQNAESRLSSHQESLKERMVQLREIRNDLISGNLVTAMGSELNSFEAKMENHFRETKESLLQRGLEFDNASDHLLMTCLADNHVQMLDTASKDHQSHIDSQTTLLSKTKAHLNVLLDEHKKTNVYENKHLVDLETAKQVLSKSTREELEALKRQNELMERTMQSQKAAREKLFDSIMGSISELLKEKLCTLQKDLEDKVNAMMDDNSALEGCKTNTTQKLESNINKLNMQTKEWGDICKSTSKRIEESLQDNKNILETVRINGEAVELHLHNLRQQTKDWEANNNDAHAMVKAANGELENLKFKIEESQEERQKHLRTISDSPVKSSEWGVNVANTSKEMQKLYDKLLAFDSSLPQAFKEQMSDWETCSSTLGEICQKKHELEVLNEKHCSNLKAVKSTTEETKEKSSSYYRTSVAHTSQNIDELENLRACFAELTSQIENLIQAGDNVQHRNCETAKSSVEKLTEIKDYESNMHQISIKAFDELIRAIPAYVEVCSNQSENVKSHAVDSTDALSKMMHEQAQKDMAIMNEITRKGAVNCSQNKDFINRLKELIVTTVKTFETNCDKSRDIQEDTKTCINTCFERLSKKHNDFAHTLSSELKRSTDMTSCFCLEDMSIEKEVSEIGKKQEFQHITKPHTPIKHEISDDSVGNVENSQKNANSLRRSFSGTPSKRMLKPVRRNSTEKRVHGMPAADTESFLRRPSRTKL